VIVVVGLGVVVLLAGYVASIGPAWGIVFRNDVGFVWWNRTANFYEPVERCADACPPFGELLDWYVEIWTGDSMYYGHEPDGLRWIATPSDCPDSFATFRPYRPARGP
jgi:hypothetical protein